jgi:EAL domain-containing protein (putative c-di-GMP-specific phosphodiesterase class I)
VDDFGTGYSSLSYLTQFPITTLKIDRSFVAKMITNERDAAVVQAIIAMSCSLKTKVIAEGVETLEQLEFLQEHVCNAAQGFLLGAPTDVDQFSAQGYKFSKPVSILELARTFEQIEIDSAASVAASLH